MTRAAILLDTHVLSELLRAKPDPAVLRWFATQAPERLMVSAITQAEMQLGVQLLPAGRRRQKLQQALQGLFAEDFADRVLPFDSAATQAYAELVVKRRKAGRPISAFDAQIAAIALCQGCALATRHTADFEGCGLALIDPWQ